MIKTIRTHYNSRYDEKGLENTLNDIAIEGNTILFVTSDYYGNGETAYTIVYKEVDTK